MSGFKRDRQGNTKRHGDGPKATAKPAVRNAFTPMFEGLRDELDAHHDRRARLWKSSRDVTALSKKIIFSLQRVRNIENELPPNIQGEVDSRLAEVSQLLAVMAPEIQGINRYRYARSLDCLEELVEALTFYHYLKTQTLISHKALTPIVDDLVRQGVAASEDAVMESPEAPESAKESEALTIGLTDEDYLYGVFDLTGEMMRFATTSSALTGKLAGGDTEDGRNIVQDMHELGSFFEMLPYRGGPKSIWEKKLEVTRQSVQKVEKLGYDLKVRGSERPKGWIPDFNSTEQEAED